MGGRHSTPEEEKVQPKIIRWNWNCNFSFLLEDYGIAPGFGRRGVFKSTPKMNENKSFKKNRHEWRLQVKKWKVVAKYDNFVSSSKPFSHSKTSVLVLNLPQSVVPIITVVIVDSSTQNWLQLPPKSALFQHLKPPTSRFIHFRWIPAALKLPDDLLTLHNFSIIAKSENFIKLPLSLARRLQSPQHLSLSHTEKAFELLFCSLFLSPLHFQLSMLNENTLYEILSGGDEEKS
jgi:hypothetical protein